MKSLPTLIKLTEKKVEAVQKEVAAYEAKIQHIEAGKKRIKAAVANGFSEAEASNEVLMLAQASQFAQKSELELNDLHEAKVNANTKKLERLEVLKALFLEQKRYEILYDRNIQAAAKKAAKKAQDALDELAQTRR